MKFFSFSCQWNAKIKMLAKTVDRLKFLSKSVCEWMATKHTHMPKIDLQKWKLRILHDKRKPNFFLEVQFYFFADDRQPGSENVHLVHKHTFFDVEIQKKVQEIDQG